MLGQMMHKGDAHLPMPLSPRLSIIAEEIAKSGYQDIIYDICADHAYLSIYLLQNKICKTVAATDISHRSIIKARKNAEKRGIHIVDDITDGTCGIAIYEGDGFSCLPGYKAGKIVVIAGIGAESMIRIVSMGIDMARAASMLIFQPMSSQELLRGWLMDNSFEICYERLAQEGDRIYSLLFCRPADKPQKYEPDDIFVGCGVKYRTEGEYIQFLLFTRRKIINRYKGLIAARESKDTPNMGRSRADGDMPCIETAKLEAAVRRIDKYLQELYENRSSCH